MEITLPGGHTISSPTGVRFFNLGEIITGLLRYIFAGAGILVLLYLLYGGFHLITSLGDPKGIQEAKNKITYAIVGFVIIFLAYWITQAAGLILGLEGVKNIFQ